MPDDKLVHQTQMQVDGDQYQIKVYCRHDGRHFAQTHFDNDDIIISDGPSLHDALARHEKLLPLAIVSRQLKRYPFKARSKRPQD